MSDELIEHIAMKVEKGESALYMSGILSEDPETVALAKARMEFDKEWSERTASFIRSFKSSGGNSERSILQRVRDATPDCHVSLCRPCAPLIAGGLVKVKMVAELGQNQLPPNCHLEYSLTSEGADRLEKLEASQTSR